MPKGDLYIIRKPDNTIFAQGISTVKMARKLIDEDALTSKATSYIIMSPKAHIDLAPPAAKTPEAVVEPVKPAKPAKPVKPKFYE